MEKKQTKDNHLNKTCGCRGIISKQGKFYLMSGFLIIINILKIRKLKSVGGRVESTITVEMIAVEAIAVETIAV